jgi:hypothetical protein
MASIPIRKKPTIEVRQLEGVPVVAADNGDSQQSSGKETIGGISEKSDDEQVEESLREGSTRTRQPFLHARATLTWSAARNETEMARDRVFNVNKTFSPRTQWSSKSSVESGEPALERLQTV